jgi:hypothetical protein
MLDALLLWDLIDETSDGGTMRGAASNDAEKRKRNNFQRADFETVWLWLIRQRAYFISR